jgi:hypothetical protein
MAVFPSMSGSCEYDCGQLWYGGAITYYLNLHEGVSYDCSPNSAASRLLAISAPCFPPAFLRDLELNYNCFNYQLWGLT